MIEKSSKATVWSQFNMWSFTDIDVKSCREKDKFTTSVFRKDTFSGVFISFSSFVALEHKFGLVYTLLHRSFTIVSDFSKFHFEV